MIEVAAAVVQRPDGSFLLAQRPPGKVYAGWWEFPGGKIEAGEAPSAALARELHEELGFEVKDSFPWLTRVFTYPHGTVRLHFQRVLCWKGDPHPREGQQVHWQKPGAPTIEPMLPANAPVLRSLALPHEYAITNATDVGPAAMLSHLERGLDRGIRLIQVREPGLPEGKRSDFTQRVLELAHRHAARVLTKAPFPGADGLHLTAAELMRLQERPAGLVAASCHTEEEMRRAQALDLDFAVLGPVRATGAKTASLGWDGFARLAQHSSIPVYAIGGLRREEMEDGWRAGAHGLAMIRGAWS